MLRVSPLPELIKLMYLFQINERIWVLSIRRMPGIGCHALPSFVLIFRSPNLRFLSDKKAYQQGLWTDQERARVIIFLSSKQLVISIR